MSKPVIGLRPPTVILAAWIVAPLLALAITLPAAHATLPEAATAWLQKLVTANRTLNYEGEMVYLQDGHMSTVGIVHHSGPDGVQERLVALDGAPREVVRGLKRLSCKLAPGEAVELPLQPSGDDAALANHLDQLNDYYHISLGDHQRIATRDTQRIDLMPRGTARYGHRLWLDVETGLPLKTQMVDNDGQVIEEAMFTDISYLAPPATVPSAHPATALPAAAAGSIDSSTDSGMDTGSRPFKLSDWHAAQLPNGFRLTTHRRIDNAAVPTEQLVYSDGMASLSIFIEALHDGEAGFNGSSRRGTITLYGRTLDGHQLTVIGEVPERTARRVGDGVQKR
jgi:sigma-E factor negative regulatory protein RseB